jgi:hypothetical protein
LPNASVFALRTAEGAVLFPPMFTLPNSLVMLLAGTVRVVPSEKLTAMLAGPGLKAA